MANVKRQNLKAKIDIAHVARLASLPLNDSEIKTFGGQLTKILDYIDKIEEAETSKVEPTYNISPNTNITRADKSNTSLAQKEALRNAGKAKDGFFVTKGVFEE